MGVSILDTIGIHDNSADGKVDLSTNLNVLEKFAHMDGNL